jgi:hypothetical protein
VTDQLRRAQHDQADAVARWRHELPELAAAVEALATIIEGGSPTLG